MRRNRVISKQLRAVLSRLGGSRLGTENDVVVGSTGALLHPADAKLLRVSLTYVLPGLAVFYVVLSGLWLVPDSFLGMYGNHDGHWASWNARGILEWGGFLDFSPVSPLTGTGSLFPAQSAVAQSRRAGSGDPGAFAAAASCFDAGLSGGVVGVALSALPPSRVFARAVLPRDDLVHLHILSFRSADTRWPCPGTRSRPLNAHLIAAMNVATIALIRVGYERVAFKLLFGFVFLAALFVAFASAPVTFVTYVPIYAVLWLAFLIPFRAQRRVVLWRWGAIAFALLVLALIGVPFYLAAMAMTSARGDNSPPIFHPGWKLLSPAYWQELLSNFPLCSNQMQLMCPSAIIGWFEIAVLAGAAFLAVRQFRHETALWLRDHRSPRIASLLCAAEHAAGSRPAAYVSTPYLMWAFFPLAPPAAIAAGSAVAGWLIGRRAASSAWVPAAASCLIAAVAIFVMGPFHSAAVSRALPGHGPLGLAPIAHMPANKGPIVDYLQQHIGLKPGSRIPRLCHHVPRRAGRPGPQS